MYDERAISGVPQIAIHKIKLPMRSRGD